MKLFILQTGEPLPSDTNHRRMRLINLFNYSTKSNIDCFIVSANFNHSLKQHRVNSSSPWFTLDETTILINSPGYSHNISFARLFDHLILSFNLFLYLISIDRQELPDVSFIGFPPIEWSFISTLIFKFRGVKTILDVKDLWPDVFFDDRPFWLKSIFALLVSPYSLINNIVFYLSDKICTPTDDFGPSWFSISRLTCPHKFITCPLVSDNSSSHVYTYAPDTLADLDSLNLVFAGTFNLTSFDFRTVFQAIYHFNLKYPSRPVHLTLAGSGPSLSSLHQLASYYSVSSFITFTGWLNQHQLSELLFSSHIGLAPYKATSNFSNHFPNKLSDYMQHALPILGTIDGISLRNPISQGFYFSYQDATSLFNHFYSLSLLSSSDFVSVKQKAFKYWSSFYRESVVYPRLVQHILQYD